MDALGQTLLYIELRLTARGGLVRKKELPPFSFRLFRI